MNKRITYCLFLLLGIFFAFEGYSAVHTFSPQTMSLDDNTGCDTTTYRLDADVPNSNPLRIINGANCFAVFPIGTDITTITTIELNGSSTASYTTNGDTVFFNSPSGTIKNATFQVVFHGVTNGSAISGDSIHLEITNSSGGTNSGNGYSFSTSSCGPSCTDGIMNQGEAGVDCGGPCPSVCATCSDGIQNQGETAVDCGGPCNDCTCTDGMQNQGETGIDSGGPCALALCSDGIQNQGETGIDCGGPCGACGDNNIVKLGANLIVDDAITITDGILDVTANNYNIALGGNWTDSSTVTDAFVERMAKVTFNGSTAQDITASNNGESFYDLEINNTGAGITLNDEVIVTNSLTLTDGIVYTFGNDLVTIANGATSSNGSSASFIDGPMQKAGNSLFNFPVGNGSIFARIGISAPGLVTDTFKAEYFDAAYSNTTNMVSSIKNVSIVEYWNLERMSGTSNVTVSLYWEDGTRSGIDDLSDLIVSRFDIAPSNEWKDHGQSSNSGTTAAGSITSNGAVSEYGPFTFGSQSTSLNPLGGTLLPIRLLYFNAQLENGSVKTHWATFIETNNNYFTVEKSKNGKDFEEVGRVNGNNSNDQSLKQYNLMDDDPYFGISYYRLKQTDFDGVESFSEIVKVDNPYLKTPPNVKIFPNPANTSQPINIQFSSKPQGEEILIVLADVMGREIFSKIYIYERDGNNVAITTDDNLQSGVYLVIASNYDEVVFKERVLIINR